MAGLAKWLSFRLRTKWLRVRVQLQSLANIIVSLFKLIEHLLTKITKVRAICFLPGLLSPETTRSTRNEISYHNICC